ncbi:MAG: hypothetical protein JHD16_01645 [Solirubrobacteraceae bacterium]|nr:hypothetical protein [Solirubrobacteraceae bacterium]
MPPTPTPNFVALLPVLRDARGDVSEVGLVPGTATGERWTILQGPTEPDHDGRAAAVRLASAGAPGWPVLTAAPIAIGVSGHLYPLEGATVPVDAATAGRPFVWHRVIDLPVTVGLGQDVAGGVGALIAADELQRQGAEPIGTRLGPVYEAVSIRAVAHNTLMWQTPGLSVTAQAFLLTIALGADTSTAARMLAAAVSCVLAVLSVQLMRKHSESEQHDRLLLERIEALASWPLGHSRLPRADSWFVRLRSRNLWIAGLALMGAVAFAVFVLSAFGTDAFSGASGEPPVVVIER